MMQATKQGFIKKSPIPKKSKQPRHFAGKVYFPASFIVGNLLADYHCPLGCGPSGD